ncbi:MAG: PD-(D/E)XK nuclease family transposase, partial [Pirellulales bacterium]
MPSGATSVATSGKRRNEAHPKTFVERLSSPRNRFKSRACRVIMSRMKPDIDPTVDYAFKHVFGREESKPAVISLLDAVLQPSAGQRIANLDLLNPFNDQEFRDDKSSV